MIGISRRVQRYVSRRPDDRHLRARLRALAAERRRFGYRRLGYLLAREGLKPNHKKLLRIYREERLKVRRRGGRKRALGTRAPLAVSLGPNQCWALDFVSDALVCGRGLGGGGMVNFWLVVRHMVSGYGPLAKRAARLMFSPGYSNRDALADWMFSLKDAEAGLPDDPAVFRFHYGLRHGTMKIGLYAPKLHDTQGPHKQDELYIVISGTGDFIKNDERRAFFAQDVIFAEAGSVHRFENFSEDFATWVIFWGPDGGEHQSNMHLD